MAQEQLQVRKPTTKELEQLAASDVAAKGKALALLGSADTAELLNKAETGWTN